LNRKPFQLIADLIQLNVFANVNQSLDELVAQKICAKYGYRFEVENGNAAGELFMLRSRRLSSTSMTNQKTCGRARWLSPSWAMLIMENDCST
jgi:hypothetical protein